MPLVFVLLWSSGFIVARFGLPYAPPLTFLILRFVGVLALLLPAVLVLRAPWPHGKIGHIAVAGLLVQAGYLAGVWCAIKLGMPAGTTALIVGMQPILTALAAPLVGERVRPRQWLGLAFGLGGGRAGGGGQDPSDRFVGGGALAVSSGAAVDDGRHPVPEAFLPQFDLRTGTLIQFSASLLVILPLAMWYEDWSPNFAAVQWTAHFVGAWLWSVLGLSIGAIFLLFALIRRSHATQVTSLLYLTPPTTAVMAWLMFGEALSPLGIAGMALAVLGVAFVVQASHPSTSQ